MYWERADVEDYIRYPSEGTAEELGSPVQFIAERDLDSEDIVQEVIDEFESKGFDYAPVRPYSTREYLDVESGDVLDIDDDQYVHYSQIMLYAINVMTEYSFALVEHPDRDSWKIITPADLNTRTAKEYLFTYYAETAKAVSNFIRSEYGIESVQEAYEDARPKGSALDRWDDAVDENVNLHPVEFMTMADLKEIVRNDEDLLEEMDFASKTQCKKAFDTVEKYRNRVMHANRSVISSEDDVVELVESLETACNMAVSAGGDEPGLDIPP